MAYPILQKTDSEIYAAVYGELERQRNSIELIASENFVSPAVLEALGSVLTNKYAEGYPAARFYGGCENVDVVESLAIKRVCELFGAQYANVQPHAGSQANQIAYQALVKPGDTVMGMNLAHGGHLTHGSPASFSGKLYNIVAYGVDPQTEMLDMDEVAAIARDCKPKMIIAGASAYPRTLDFAAFGAIAKEVGAYLMVDLAHIAGLVAGHAHPGPLPYADIVTSTSHKTLRGPRAGFMFTNSEEVIKKVNKAAFPGVQGGPLMHAIAAKAVAFAEANTPEFEAYAHQVVKNCAAMGRAMVDGGLRLCTGGTDNHLCLVDLTAAGINGLEAQNVLESVGITANRNTIPNETLPPSIASGLRVGSAAMTTRGIDEDEAYLIGELIATTLYHKDDSKVKAAVAEQVKALLVKHPLYPELG